MLGLQGHEGAINSVRFTNKVSEKDRKSNATYTSINNITKNTTEMKTIEQIREEAKQNIEARMKRQQIEDQAH
jgi:hypothetical protein